MVDDGRNERERRKRNVAIALVLFGLVVLFFLMTLVHVHP